MEGNSGSVSLEPGKRLSVLEQDHNRYDNNNVLETVILGNKELFEIKKQIDDLYSNEDFSDEDAEKAGELQIKFEEMDGWNAEADAAYLLSSLGIKEDTHQNMMDSVDQKVKVKILLAQCIFGNPDVLIMDEPTNHLDMESIEALNHALDIFEGTVIFVSHDREFISSLSTRLIEVKKEKSRGDVWQFYGKSFVEDQLACESSFAAMVVRLDDNKK